MRSECTMLLLVANTFLVSCTEEGDTITNVSAPEDWHGPEIEWISPPEAEVRGIVGLDAAISDSSTIEIARLYLDGVSRSQLTASPWRFEVITDSLEDGIHVVEVRAWDEYGNLGISPTLRINVVNGFAEGPQLRWVPDDFELIQSAINASQDFDTIRVRDGVYYETLNLFGKGLWIESENGPVRCTIDADESSRVFAFAPSSVVSTVRGIKMVGGINLVSIDYATVHIVNNILISDIAEGLILTSYSGGRVTNNLFGGARYPVQIGFFWGQFRNNVIQHASEYAMWNATTGRNPLEYGHNLFWNNVRNYYNFEPGNGDIYANPMINLEGGFLVEGSPCIDAGYPEILDRDGSRSDIGPFGGPWAYN